MAEERLPEYEEKDLKLLRSKPIFTNFGDARFRDCLELHIYSGENVLESNYGVNTWSVDEKDTKNRAPSTKIDIHGDIRRMGYSTGTFGVKYNFLRKLVGDADSTLYIDEISGDRKEVRLRPRSVDAGLRQDFMSFGERSEGTVLSGHDWWPDVYLNFGQDVLVLAVNFAMDYEAYPREPHSIIFKLYEPLPDVLEDGDECWITQQICESVVEDIKLSINAKTYYSRELAPPDFSLAYTQDKPTPTGWKSESDLLEGSDTTTQQKLLRKLYSSSYGDVKINIDFDIPQHIGDDVYDGFKNVVHFGSVVTKLENFKYKLLQIENYDANINRVSSDLEGLSGAGATGSLFYKTNKLKWESKKNELIGAFTPLESHLYNTSQSYVSNSFGEFIPFSWPKLNAAYPYVQAPVKSAAVMKWYGQVDNPTGDYYNTGLIYSASRYDMFNDNALEKLIPRHIALSEENDQYVGFVNMVADHYDEHYLYIKHSLDIHSRENKITKGIAKELLEPVLKSFGWKPYQSFDFDTIWDYNLGITASGSWGGVLKFTASVQQTSTAPLQNGKVTVTGINGGVAPYSYEWYNVGAPTNNSYLLNTPSISNLGVGNAFVRVRDSEGLSATATPTITVGTATQSVFSIAADRPTSASNSQRIDPISKDDIAKELWKRMLNNLPHILKTKGTEESIRSVISAYGLPSTILKIHEYGGPQKLPGRHSKNIHDRFSYSLNLTPSSNVTGSWAPVTSSNNKISYPNTMQVRFNIPNKKENKQDMVLWNTYSGSVAVWMEHTSSYVSKESGSVYGRMVFGLRSGSFGHRGDHKYITSSTEWAPLYDNDWWSVMLTRTEPGFKKITGYAFTSSNNLLDHEAQDLRYDLFCKKMSDYSRFGRINWAVSASLDISGSLGEPSRSYNRAWGSFESVSGSTTLPIIDSKFPITLRHYLGGATSSDAGDNFLAISASHYGASNPIAGFSGSVQEFRLWQTPLSESSFTYHVQSPTSIAANNITGSYDELLVRWSMGADLLRYPVSHSLLMSSSHPYGRSRFQTSSGTPFFPTKAYLNGFDHLSQDDLTNTARKNRGYSEEEERYYTLMPRSIGPTYYSEKIRLEDNKLRGDLHPIQKREISSFDTNPLDSNKLGVFFSPTDEIDLDIASELGPFDFDNFVGDPRDTYNKKYTELIRLNNHYWRKHLGNPDFFQFLRILRYFDASLFRTVRQLIPARAKGQVGLLVKPHLLERPRILKYPSASKVGYKVNVDEKPKTDMTILDAYIAPYESASLSGYSAGEGGPFIYTGLKGGSNIHRNGSNRLGRREGGFMLTPSHSQHQLTKTIPDEPQSNAQILASLDHRTVGEFEGGIQWDDKYGYFVKDYGSRYIHTTVEFPKKTGAGVDPFGARVWNAYYRRDAWGMTIHTPPHPGIHGAHGYNYDNFTASSAPDVTDGYVRYGLNRKHTSEQYVPFISQSRKSFERYKQNYYFASEFSQSLGKAIPRRHIQNWGNPAILGGSGHIHYKGSSVPSGSMPSHSLSESAEYQDFKQTALQNLYWHGCKLVGSDFNMESAQTVDGGPVVEYYDVSPFKYVAADENADGKLLTAGEGIGQQLAIRQQQAPVGRTFQQPPGQNLRGATPTPRGRNFNRGS